MTVEITYIISLVFGIAGFISIIYNLGRNRKLDIKQDANIAFELKALQTSLTEFKTEIRMSIESNSKMTMENRERIIKVEESTKQAHKCIDSFEQN